MTILIIGGTGRVGSAAIDTLLGSGASVRCLSHSQEKLAALPKGVEHAFADLDDPSTLPAAFDGVRAVLLSLAVHPNEEARGLASIDAAVAAGVSKVVHISLNHYPGADERVFYQAKQAIEPRLRRSDFASTIIRSANFYQSDSTLKTYIVDSGIYPPPIGHVGVNRIDSRDVGHAAAMALMNETYDGQEAELYGSKTFTGESVAKVYSQALGRPVRYMGDDIEAWAELNSPRLGPWYVNALKGLYEQQQKYGMLPPEGAMQHPLLPERLRSFEDYAADLIDTWTR
jgi:uncharacterized protein YbjT (DUF2867 family)